MLLDCILHSHSWHTGTFLRTTSFKLLGCVRMLLQVLWHCRVKSSGCFKGCFCGSGWAFADSLLHRLAPLWVGARGLEFTWDYLLQGLEANANLVHFLLWLFQQLAEHQLYAHWLQVLYCLQVFTISFAALGSLMWLRKNKPKFIVPLIYVAVGVLATMSSIIRSVVLALQVIYS